MSGHKPFKNLTRDANETIRARAECDLEFRTALSEEAEECDRSGDTETARLLRSLLSQKDDGPMSWNYRVVVKSDKDETWFGIHEAYYDAAGRVTMISENAIAPCGESLEELVRDLDNMQHAFDQPALRYEDIGKGEAV